MTEPAAGQEPKPGEGQEPMVEPKPDLGQEPKTYDEEYVKGLRREAAGYRTRLNTLEEAENQRKAAEMSEVERLNIAKEEADKKAQGHEKALKTERLTYTAERLATKLGGKPERAEGIARLADLAGVEFDDNGKPDSKQVEEAIQKTLEEYPELKASQRLNNEGFTPVDDLENGEKNPFERGEHFNVTKQGEIYKKSPELAKRLQKAAKN